MSGIFTNSRIQKHIIDTKAQLKSYLSSTSTEMSEVEHTQEILDSIIAAPVIWDERCEVSTALIFNDFSAILKTIDNKESLDMLFAYCLTFLIEIDIKFDADLIKPLSKAINFGIQEINSFSFPAQQQIKLALYKLPYLITKEALNGNNMKVFESVPGLVKKAEETINDWETGFTERERKINAQIEKLDTHKTAFNFVGLYDGFKQLGEAKRKEFLWSKWILCILAFITLLPIACEAYYFMKYAVDFSLKQIIIRTIPIISLTFIFIYYFRIALSNFNSIKAQLAQIELRKSLCAFIQNYAEYANSLQENNKNALVKFEDIIFSNIMTSEDKIPSTFDGLDQLVSLIRSVRGSEK